MQQYITELSKYVIAGAMVVYTVGILIGIWLDDQKQRVLYVWQCLLMFLIQAVCFADLALAGKRKEYVVFYVFVQILLLTITVLVPLIYEGMNRMLLSGMAMMLGIGLCMISRLSFSRAVRQYIIALIALMIALVIPYLFSKAHFLKKLKWVYGGIGLGMLTLVLILGKITYGSKLSFTFSFEIAQVTFQPSEFVKILFLFFLAGILWDNVSLPRLAISALLAGLHVVILVLSRDLGSALIFFVAYVFLAFIATGNYLCLLAGALGGCAASFSAYRLFAHVRTRVLAWRDPWSYIDAQGYAITQSLFAIGSGSWFGMGLMQGTPDDIPYVMEDFMFSSVCEELGVLFGICVILVAVGMFLAMIRAAVRIGDRFYQMIVYGVGIMYLFQIFLTVGGGVKFIPLTGVTLPFLSYGGSSVMVSMILFFIVQGIYIRMKQEEGRHAAKRKAADLPVVTRIRKPIPVSGCLFVALFTAMTVYLAYFTATSEQEMINNSYNSRQEILLSRNYRGTIYSEDGRALAETVVDADQNETRVYPYGNLFSHVVGYSTQGRMGLEALANYYLINTDISLGSKAANDAAGVKNPGNNVYTSLNVELQELADDLLGMYQGAVVVTEVETGRVLAMVSHPDFDPNEIADIWDSLLQDKDSSVLVNRALQGLYPPGSTFKIVTALEYIRENPDTYDRYSFTCPGYYTHGDSRISCYHGMSHGKVDFTASFAKSCNASFANIGMSLDREQLRETLDDLLFDRELPLELRYAESRVHVTEEISDSEMMQTSIGQGKTQITPMHLNMITCAVANDGVLMTPRFIDRVESAEGDMVKSFKSEKYGKLMTKEEAELLRKMMEAVVTEGTASKLDGRSYTAAGKTGSAEYNNVKGDSHAWFTGFAPAEDPEICITIIIEGAGSGGDYAVPLARRLFDCYFEGKDSPQP